MKGKKKTVLAISEDLKKDAQVLGFKSDSIRRLPDTLRRMLIKYLVATDYEQEHKERVEEDIEDAIYCIEIAQKVELMARP